MTKADNLFEQRMFDITFSNRYKIKKHHDTATQPAKAVIIIHHVFVVLRDITSTSTIKWLREKKVPFRHARKGKSTSAMLWNE